MEVEVEAELVEGKGWVFPCWPSCLKREGVYRNTYDSIASDGPNSLLAGPDCWGKPFRLPNGY